MPRHFPSKVDSWFYLTIVGVVLALAFPVYNVLVYSPQETGKALPLLLMVALAALGLPLWLLFGTGYTLDAKELVIRSGPFSWTVPVADIERITPTRNPLSSPALSLDRLLIIHRRGQVMISPADKAGFLRELEALRATRPEPPAAQFSKG